MSTKSLKTCIQEVFRKKFVDLKAQIELNLESVAAQLYADGIITETVYEGRTFFNIHKCFIHGLKDDTQQCISHCEKFFKALENEGGPFESQQA